MGLQGGDLDCRGPFITFGYGLASVLVGEVPKASLPEGRGQPMFERYTERARRVLFFARYEASQLGSISIETEHLLLGLIREGKGLTSRIFARSHLSLEGIRKEIEGRTVCRE